MVSTARLDAQLDEDVRAFGATDEGGHVDGLWSVAASSGQRTSPATAAAAPSVVGPG
jgi:hypothetical protein